jgi:hypothetical protein
MIYRYLKRKFGRGATVGIIIGLASLITFAMYAGLAGGYYGANYAEELLHTSLAKPFGAIVGFLIVTGSIIFVPASVGGIVGFAIEKIISVCRKRMNSETK